MKVYEYIVRIKDQASDKLRRLGTGISSGTKGVDRYSQSLNDAEKASNNLGGASSLLARFLGPAVLGATFASLAMKASALAAKVEQTKISFEVMVGSVEEGQSLFKEVTQLANVTPFTGEDLQDSTKLLLNFGVASKKVIPTLKMLGDISGGDANRLHYLTLAFAQTSAAGRLTGQDLLQMVNAGFNPLQEISRKTGKSLAQLKKDMEAGAISADMVEAAFKSATESGGRFFGMMERQSQTFEGRMSTMKDKWEIVLGAWGKSLNDKISPILDNAISKLDRLIDKTAAIGNENSKEANAIRKLNTEIKPLLDRYKELADIKHKSADESREILEIDAKIKKDFPAGRLIKGNKVIGVDADKGIADIEKQNKAFHNSRVKRVFELEADLKKAEDVIKNKGEQTGINAFLFGKDMSLDPVANLLKAEQEKVKILDQLSEIDATRELIHTPFENDYVAGSLVNDPVKPTENTDGLDKITGGGKQSVNVTINLDSLIGTQNFDVKNMKETVRDMEKDVTEALLRVLNSANYAAAQ